MAECNDILHTLHTLENKRGDLLEQIANVIEPERHEELAQLQRQLALVDEEIERNEQALRAWPPPH